jgi:hypothetical protein
MLLATYTTEAGIDREIQLLEWPRDDYEPIVLDYVVGVIGPEADPRIVARCPRDLEEAETLAREYVEDCLEAGEAVGFVARDIVRERKPESEVLARYRNRDGARAVVLTVLDDTDDPYSLADRPDNDEWAGTHFLLGAHRTLEAAQKAAERHADACVEHGTYEVWHHHYVVGALA